VWKGSSPRTHRRVFPWTGRPRIHFMKLSGGNLLAGEDDMLPIVEVGFMVTKCALQRSTPHWRGGRICVGG